MYHVRVARSLEPEPAVLLIYNCEDIKNKPGATKIIENQPDPDIINNIRDAFLGQIAKIVTDLAV